MGLTLVCNYDPSGSGLLSSADAAFTNSEVASLFSREKLSNSSVRRLKILLFETYSTARFRNSTIIIQS
jgi:hypothetical protein